MLSRFLKDRNGNVAMLFALSIVPIFGAIGLGVDYTRATTARTDIQKAADAAALALAHASVNLKPEELQKIADDIIARNLGPGGAALKPTVTVTREQDVLKIVASAQVGTTFLKALQIDSVDVSGASKVVWGGTNIEVVLALDNTGSMKGTKLAELKKAAGELIDTLEKTATRSGSVKIGLVPFATTVRVDPASSKDEEWIRFDDQTDWYQDRHGKWKSNTRAFNKDAWGGCIEDRDQPYDVSDESYEVKKRKTLYPAVESCPSDERNLAVVMPLGTNFQGLRDAVDSMEAAGNTNVTIGIAWAQSLLSNKAPFEEGASETGEGKTLKYMIVLTDGENTRNRFSSNTSAIDERTKKACKAARDAGTVFTIRVIEGSADLLRECASEENNYYDVENAAEMTPVFRAIANKIAKLRIAS